MFDEYAQVLSRRYPDILIEGANYLPPPVYQHAASLVTASKLLLIVLIVVGKDPFVLFGVRVPGGVWAWGQANKMYACMTVFFTGSMVENQLLSTGAFEITLNDVPVWSKLQSGHLPSVQQLVQIIENQKMMNGHGAEAMSRRRS